MTQVLAFLNAWIAYIAPATTLLVFIARVLSRSEAPTLWGILPWWCDVTTWTQWGRVGRLGQAVVAFVLAGGTVLLAGIPDGIALEELQAAFWAGIEAMGIWSFAKKFVETKKSDAAGVAGRKARAQTLAAIVVLMALPGCAASFEESKLAGLDPQARAAEPPPTERCQSLDAMHRDWGGVAKGAGVLAGASGISTWPVEGEKAEIGLAIGAGVSAAVAATAVYISEGAAESWTRECSQ